MPPTTPTPTDVQNLLIAAIIAEGAVISVLFWQLIKAKDALAEAYEKLLPINTTIMNAIQAIEKISTRFEDWMKKQP